MFMVAPPPLLTSSFPQVETGRETGGLSTHPLAALAPTEHSSTQPRRILSLTHRMTGWWWSITQQDQFAPRVDILPQDALLEYTEAYMDLECLRLPTHSDLDNLFLWLDEIPGEYFEHVHLAHGAYATPTKHLPKLLHHLARVCRCGGSFRWTENTFPHTTSPAFEQLIIITLQTLQATGLGFPPYGSAPEARDGSVLFYMVQALREIGCSSVKHFPLTIDVSASTVLHTLFARQVDLLSALLSRSHLVRQSEEAIQTLYHQRQEEVAQSTFEGTCSLHTVYGIKTQSDFFSSVLAIVSDAMG